MRLTASPLPCLPGVACRNFLALTMASSGCRTANSEHTARCYLPAELRLTAREHQRVSRLRQAPGSTQVPTQMTGLPGQVAFSLKNRFCTHYAKRHRNIIVIQTLYVNHNTAFYQIPPCYITLRQSGVTLFVTELEGAVGDASASLRKFGNLEG